MNSLNDSERRAYTVIESALQTYPRDQAPSRLAVNVMARVQALPRRAAVRPKFEFPWLELLVSFLLPMMLGVAWLVWRILPPVYWSHLRLQWLIMMQQVGLVGRGDFLVWLIPLGMLLAVFCLGLAATLFTFQRSQN